MKVSHTALAGVFVIHTTAFVDPRGAFTRLYCERELLSVMNGRRVAQINHSHTATVGAVRGMHYQKPPDAELKLVRCLKGRVWDVAVDLRAGSRTFLQWHAEELTPKNSRTLLIPEGCAHGFQVLEPDSELLYLHTAFYEPHAEGGVSCSDPRLGITWPLTITYLSNRDRSYPAVEPDFAGISI